MSVSGNVIVVSGAGTPLGAAYAVPIIPNKATAIANAVATENAMVLVRAVRS